MDRPELPPEETRNMLLHVARDIIASKDVLTQADKAIGDGDHGVGMARGFDAVHRKLDSQAFFALDELLKTTGMALMTSVGGAAGAIFGTFFRGGAKRLAGRATFDSQALSVMLSDGLEAVQARGKAQVGDKTMVDALEPAALAAEQFASAPLSRALLEAAKAAGAGMARTRDMVASVGKAKTLGERSLGHADPGAITLYLILRSMAEFTTGEEIHDEFTR
jgi:dihydroxyacetone kinase-like protein